MLDSVDIYINKAKGKLEKVKFEEKENQEDKENFEKSLSTFFIEYKKQSKWLNKYFTKSKFARKFMFYE